MTSKERTRKYRLNLKKDEEKWKAVKLKDSVSHKEARIKLQEIRVKKTKTVKEIKQIDAIRKRDRERKRLQRLSKSTLVKGNDSVKAYISPRTLGKAVKRVSKNLPKSPRKRKAVLHKIIWSEGIDIKSGTTCLQYPRKKRSDYFGEDIQLYVQSFFENDDISRVLPGKKDVKTVKTAEGHQQYQKRLLTMTLQEAYQVFKKDNPEMNNVGISKFCQFRPEWVVCQYIQCCCYYCENLQFKLDALKKTTGLKLTKEEAVYKSVCSFDNLDCCVRECSKCGVEKLNCFLNNRDLVQNCTKDKETNNRDTGNVENGLLLVKNDNEANDILTLITWKEWNGSKLNTINASYDKLVISICNDLLYFSEHLFVWYNQSQHIKELKKSLVEGEFIMQLDFAENYTFVIQQEIQSHYYKQEQCTIHPVVLYGRDILQSFVVVSDELKHDVTFVYEVQKKVIQLIQQLFNKINKIHYISDGSSAQYKNKKNFLNLSYHRHDFGCEGDWHFFETGHGKGVCDGIGGTTKREISRAALKGHLFTSANDIYLWSQDHISKIKVILVSPLEIETTRIFLDKRWVKDLKPIPGTHKMHHIQSVEPGILKTTRISKYNNFCIFSILPNINVDQEIATGTERMDLPKTVPKVSDFVIVKFYGKKSVRSFVGQVIAIYADDETIHVKYMRSASTKNVFRFPDQEDDSVVSLSDILCILQDPHISSRGLYTFQNVVDITE